MIKNNFFLILILIFVIFIILGSVCFILYRNRNQVQSKNKIQTSYIPENINNPIIEDTNVIKDNNAIEDTDVSKDANIIINEVKNNNIEKQKENNITEANNENSKVIKQEIKTTTKTTQPSTQSKNNSSNNNSNVQKEEKVIQNSTPQDAILQSSSSNTNNSQNKKEEIKTESKVEKCTNNNNHFMGIGNAGKWFDTKKEAIAYYEQKIKYWGDKWENKEIDNDTYYKNCPYGYEIWDCMYCSKWTINFYYR